MTFKNGYHGVKKVFVAEILSLIGFVCMLVTGIIGVASIGLALAGPEAAGTALILTGVFGIATAVLMVISYIMNLVGLHQAGKDEEYFRKAFIIAIFVLILSVVSAVLGSAVGSNGVIDDIVDLAQRLANIAVIFLVVYGIQRFAQKLNYEKLVKRGNTVAWLIAIPYLISAVVDLVSGLIGVDPGTQAVSGVLVIIAGIIGIIGNIMYLVYLGQGKTMLKNN